MATIKVDIDFKPAKHIIKAAVKEGALASAYLVKKRADKFVHVGRWRRNVYKKGKYKGKAWTSRRPGRLKKSGRVYRSMFEDGGAVVMYGSTMAFYSFMHHHKTRYLERAKKAAAADIEREIAGRIEAALR